MFSSARFQLVEERRICSGHRDYMGRHINIESCFRDCQDSSFTRMFSFGTNDFGETECDEIDGCKCFCEMDLDSDGNCKLQIDNGFHLYIHNGNIQQK